MGSQEQTGKTGSRQTRVDPPHCALPGPPPEEVSIRRIEGGLIISGKVNRTDANDVLRQVAAFLLQETPDTSPDSDRNPMERASQPTRTEARLVSGGVPADEEDVLNWDNLIPVPPARPSWRIRVRLKKASRDVPLPAEDPWAK